MNPNTRRMLEQAGINPDEFSAAVAAETKNAFRSSGVTDLDRSRLIFPESRMHGYAPDADPNNPFKREQPPASRQLLADWFAAVFESPMGFAHLHPRAAKNAMLVRALNEGTDSEGGYLVPPGFVPELIRDVPKLTQLFQYVRKIPVGTMTGELPVVSANPTVSWGTESTAMDEGDPAFGTGTWSCKRLNVFAALSREVLSDSNPAIVSTIVTLFQEAIAKERDRVIAMGNASAGEPVGLYSASGITDVSSVVTLSYSSILALHSTIDHRYLASPSCKWTMNQRVKSAIMGIVDTTGRPIFVQDVTTGWKPMLLGNGVCIEEAFPNNYLGFGDLNYYVWFDRETLAIERSTEAGDAFRKHQMYIKLFERCDGKPLLPPKVPLCRTRVLTGIS
ncbi:MAG: phage major capsid protein [Pirellulales bacterium]